LGPWGSLFVSGAETLLDAEQNQDTGALHEYRYDEETQRWE
jgi:hypothetical protein